MYELAKKLARENNDLLWCVTLTLCSPPAPHPTTHAYTLVSLSDMFPCNRWTIIAVTERYIHCRGGRWVGSQPQSAYCVPSVLCACAHACVCVCVCVCATMISQFPSTLQYVYTHVGIGKIMKSSLSFWKQNVPGWTTSEPSSILLCTLLLLCV